MTPSPPARRVLIADDERFICQILRRMLTRLGLEVVGEAHDGAECLQLYREHSPDLVLMDIAMPGMDGLAALQALLEIDPQACVLMCTSFSSKQYIVEAVRLGARGYLSKPFDLEKIREKVHSICGPVPAAR